MLKKLARTVTKRPKTVVAIVHFVERTGAIITACGIIMASAFASMIIISTWWFETWRDRMPPRLVK